MKAQSIKVLLFDLGGVIIDLFPQYTIAAFAKLSSKSEAAVTAAYEKGDMFQPHEKGLIENEEFRNLIQQHFEFDATPANFDEAWNAMLGDIPKQVLEAINALKVEYQCCVLSNTNAIHEKAFHQILAEQHGPRHLDEIFDQVFFSHELQERKPDAVIYQKVINKLGVEAEEILFLDDSEENIAAAKAVGMQGLYIPRNGGFQELLTAYLKG